jgi:hypothetical protein
LICCRMVRRRFNTSGVGWRHMVTTSVSDYSEALLDFVPGSGGVGGDLVDRFHRRAQCSQRLSSCGDTDAHPVSSTYEFPGASGARPSGSRALKPDRSRCRMMAG